MVAHRPRCRHNLASKIFSLRLRGWHQPCSCILRPWPTVAARETHEELGLIAPFTCAATAGPCPGYVGQRGRAQGARASVESLPAVAGSPGAALPQDTP